MELRSLISNYDKPIETPIKHGDFVRFKHGFSIIRDDEHLVFMYWRALDPASFFDRKFIEDEFSAGVPSCPDCLIAYKRDGHTLFMPMDSRVLERHEP